MAVIDIQNSSLTIQCRETRDLLIICSSLVVVFSLVQFQFILFFFPTSQLLQAAHLEFNPPQILLLLGYRAQSVHSISQVNIYCPSPSLVMFLVSLLPINHLQYIDRRPLGCTNIRATPVSTIAQDHRSLCPSSYCYFSPSYSVEVLYVTSSVSAKPVLAF